MRGDLGRHFGTVPWPAVFYLALHHNILACQVDPLRASHVPHVPCVSKELRIVHTACAAGQPYPPGLAQVTRLQAFLQASPPGSSFTGGGCVVRRLGRSWGRHALCVALADQQAAEAAVAAAAKLGRRTGEPTPRR